MGIKESKEFLEGNLELLVFIVSRLKDGADLSDAIALFSKLTGEEDFRSKLIEAYNGITLIDDEARELDLNEGLELVMLVISYLPKLMGAAK